MALNYYELNDGTDDVPNSLLAGMLRARHSCNPDFEKRYPSVVKWYAEIDPTKALVLREIGFDDSGHPIVFGPFGRNDGLWTGVSMSIGVESREAPQVEKKVFDAAWTSLENTYHNKIPPKRIEPRIPVSDIDQLVGRWSAGILQGPGGMSDQFITFLPNEKGYFADYNVALMYYHEFEWEIVDSGRITIRGTTCYHRDDNSQIVESPSTFEYKSVAAETQVHHSGSGTSIEVLFLQLANEERAWIADAYGRCAVSVSVTDRPKFR